MTKCDSIPAFLDSFCLVCVIVSKDRNEIVIITVVLAYCLLVVFNLLALPKSILVIHTAKSFFLNLRYRGQTLTGKMKSFFFKQKDNNNNLTTYYHIKEY